MLRGLVRFVERRSGALRTRRVPVDPECVIVLDDRPFYDDLLPARAGGDGRLDPSGPPDELDGLDELDGFDGGATPPVRRGTGTRPVTRSRELRPR